MEVSDLEDGTEPTKIINVTNEESLNLMGSPPDAVASPSDDLSERRSSNSSLTSVTSVAPSCHPRSSTGSGRHLGSKPDQQDGITKGPTEWGLQLLDWEGEITHTGKAFLDSNPKPLAK
ncbi:hypothetical protein C7M84_004034 [Penaeus vannamei]|uniref:Uncharacterized protein n=1 Tax=Penaeus vannamei TaxID=6689 RepID=A0A423TLK8_PENVA|nr:hypothetical protein C7M84_004034 [Penaeus vannamei]